MIRNRRKKAYNAKGIRASAEGATRPQPDFSGRQVVMMKVSSITVDPKLKALVPRSSPPELHALTESIRRHGVRDPVHVRGADGVLIDGHTRLEICRKLNPDGEIPAILEGIPATADLTEWVIQAAVERRQLSPWQLVKMAPTLLALEKQKAKARILAGTALAPKQAVGEGVPSKGRSTDIVAKILGLGTGEYLRQGLAVLNSDRKDLIMKLDQGEISIHHAWELLQQDHKKKSNLPPFKHCLRPLAKLKEWLRSAHSKKRWDVDDLELGRQLLASLQEMAGELKKWSKDLKC